MRIHILILGFKGLNTYKTYPETDQDENFSPRPFQKILKIRIYFCYIFFERHTQGPSNYVRPPQPVWERLPSRVSGWIAGSNKLNSLHGDPGLICGAVKPAVLNNLPQERDHTLCSYRKNTMSLILISLYEIAPLCILLLYACFCTQ